MRLKGRDAALLEDCVGLFVDPQALPFILEKGLDRAGTLYDAYEVREGWDRMIADVAAGRRPESLFQLYLHCPFCLRVCHFCNLNAAGLKADAQRRRYVRHLTRSIEFFSPSFSPVAFRSLFFGGGTPSVLSAAELEEVFSALERSFKISRAGERCIEVHPGSFTREKLEAVARHGFNKINFGVQSLDSAVLAGENRGDQTDRAVREMARAIRKRREIRCLNIDLILGLQNDSEETFLGSFLEASRLEPDTITIYPLHPTEPYLARFYGGSLEAFYRRFDGLSPLVTGAVLEAAGRSGYRLETHPDRWYFRLSGGSSADEHGGYADRAAQPVSVLGLGPGARSHIAGSMAYAHRAGAEARFDPAEKAYRGHRFDPELERLKFILGGLLSSPAVSREDFAALFRGDITEPFGAALRGLEDSGRVRLEPGVLRFLGGSRRERLIDALSLIGPARLRAMLDSYNYGNFRFSIARAGKQWQVWVERAQEGASYALRAEGFGLAVSGPRGDGEVAPGVKTFPKDAEDGLPNAAVPSDKMLGLVKAVFLSAARRSGHLCADELTLLLQRSLKRVLERPDFRLSCEGVRVREPAPARGAGADGKSA